MTLDDSWKLRAEVLRRDAERLLVEPLSTHGWTASIEKMERAGEYALVSAARHGTSRRVALLYSSATSNEVYRHLETLADLTLFNGQPYMVEQFTRGLTRPPSSVFDFQRHLIEWNRASAPGKLAPPSEIEEELLPEHRSRRLVSESPIDAIWSRLSRLKSGTLAKKAIRERIALTGLEPEPDAVAAKGEGVAYAIRSAEDYFSTKGAGNVSQRVLNVYYGCLSLAFAEMLAAPEGARELSAIEDITKNGGHGLWTLGSEGDAFGDLAVGPTSRSGFFPAWCALIGCSKIVTLERRPRKIAELVAAPADGWATLQQMFGRIPEVGDLFEDTFASRPFWVKPVPDIASSRNLWSGFDASRPIAVTTYVLLVDDSGRMTAEDVAALPGPIREISAVPSGRRAHHFRVAIDHEGHQHWFGALQVHRSPFERAALICPLFGGVTEYRAICLAILYALSIVVRYRPSLWRRIQEGDLDHFRALIEAFLTTVERVLPEEFMKSITGEVTSVAQPGSWLA